MPRRIDRLEQVSRYATLVTFAVCVLVFLMSPVWALSWRKEPFPGFLTETTLVVNSRSAEDWSGQNDGLVPPFVVIRLGGIPVENHEDFHKALAAYEIGDRIPIFAVLPDGNVRLFPDVELMAFPARDFNRMFWLPYIVGLAYFGIAVWIYLLRGRDRPGRALAFFSANVAVVSGLLFDVLTTHHVAPIWMFSLAMLGGALISLSLRFPIEWTLLDRKPWLLGIPYLISAALVIWALFFLWNTQNPWQFLAARSMVYRYVAISALIFLVVMIYRARTGYVTLARRQARLVLAGSLLAFLPMIFWFLAPTFGLEIPFNSGLLLPGLLLFPISLGVAIQRYRLKEFDTFVNRTIVYALVTAILAGIFTALAGLSQRLFVVLTGEKSDAAIVLTTLIVASVITPLKTIIQNWVDRRWRGLPASELRTFGDEVRFFIQMNDINLLAERFLQEAVHSLRAVSGAVVLFSKEGEPELRFTHGSWRGYALISVPLVCQGERYGHVMIGPRRDGTSYHRFEVDSLNQVAGHVARAIKIAETLHAVIGIPPTSDSLVPVKKSNIESAL